MLKYYDEAKMRAVREALEAEVLAWPGVARKEMMGCLCYFRGKRFFAFLVTNGIVVTKLGNDDRSALSGHANSKPFEMAGKTSSTWAHVTIGKPDDLEPVLPKKKKSYDAASSR